MTLITEHGLKVVDDMTIGARAVSDYNDDRLGGLSEAIDHGKVSLVTIDDEQVEKCQGVRPFFQKRQRLVIPEPVQLPVDLTRLHDE
jgi:hypothetical protein